MRSRSQASLFTPAPLPVARLEDTERIACLRLIRSSNVGPVTFRELINHYGGAGKALEALPDLSRRGGSRSLQICPKHRAEAELEAAHRAGAEAIFTIEPGYPPALAAIDAPPPMLYVKGRAEYLTSPAVAIVGSRSASAAGLKLARMFATDLGAAGYAICSGLARGIDAAAHEAALKSGTIAVLAGGIDFVYPPEHAALQHRIACEGVLITELPPGFVPRANDFPRRNRIISGLALGVVIVEAARRSGTLVTARYAAEHGREVFAVPGHPLDSRAEGTNQLIKTGATLVTSAVDVLEALAPIAGNGRPAFREPPLIRGPLPIEPRPLPEISDRDRDKVLAALGPHPIEVDEILRATGLDARAVQIALMELDLAGRIERHGSQLVSKIDSLSEGSSVRGASAQPLPE